MTHNIQFRDLGFYFNSLLDYGKVLSLETTHEKIMKKELFPWLFSQFEVSTYYKQLNSEEKNIIDSYFISMSHGVNEEKKFCIEKNGLCLLVAYCFDAINPNESKLF